ncbi:MAG: hypothetical protein ACLQJF_16215 [Candidatus Sulfotelmatobacter sp.]
MAKTLVVQIPDELDAALRTERLRTGCSTSEFVRRATAALLAAKDESEPYCHIITGVSYSADEVEAKAEQARLENRI